MAVKISSPRRSKVSLWKGSPADRSQPDSGRPCGRSAGLALRLCGLSLLLIGLVGLNGCGLSGGSVPIGDGPKTVLQGTVVLPGEQPAVGATVVVRTMASSQAVQTTVTEAAGAFVASHVPTNGDLEVVVSTVDGATLKAVVPHSQLIANPSSQPLNIGIVNLFSTEVAASIELEIAARPLDTSTIVATQYASLVEALQSLLGGSSGGSGSSPQELTDPNLLQMRAKQVIIATANVELVKFNPKRDTASASVLLEGLVGYMNAVHNLAVVLTTEQKMRLINAEVQGFTYTPTVVTAALQTAGSSGATVGNVQAASLAERKQLALAQPGAAISPFEALLIAADSGDLGSFHLDPTALHTFLQQLLDH